MSAEADLFAPVVEPELKTTVVNISQQGVKFDVYIGRCVPARGLDASKWANPFKITKECDRPQALARFEKHLDASPELLAALPELKGKTLGCWCAPKACHGHILARRADGLPSNALHRLEAEMVKRHRPGWRMIKDERGRMYRWNERVEFLKHHGLIPASVTEWEDITVECAEDVLAKFAAEQIRAERIRAEWQAMT